LKVLLCDDHRMFVESLASVLQRRGHDVVYAETPGRAVSAATHEDVDVCVMDLRFSPSEDISALDAIEKLSMATDVVVLTADPSALSEALLAGARVCLEKHCPVERLVNVLEDRRITGVASGDAVYRPDCRWSSHALARFLTHREREVLEALANGESTADLARRLGVGPATVRTHVQNVLAKLGVHSRLEAVAFAIRHGLVELDESDRWQGKKTG